MKKRFAQFAFLVQYYSKKLVFRFRLRLPNIRKAHLTAFPAVHLKRSDWFDIFFKFSSELLVICLAIVVGFLNVIFFKFGAGKTFHDNSHAFALLSNHTSLNPQYYAKETSVSTILFTGKSLIAQAYANDSTAALTATSPDPADTSDGGMIEGDVLVKPNPDSIKTYIAKQIKIYETQPGDTIASIAQSFGISQQTILDTNNLLGGTVVKPGWQLIILPTDGILYKAGSNDTLPDIANKFGGNVDTIISYNGLDSAEDINPGDVLIIPGGHLAPPPVPKTTPKAKTNTGNGAKVGGSAPIEEIQPEIDIGGGHIFPKGYCTWYVAQKLGGKVKWGGNAKNWIVNSKAYGAVVDMDPAPGTILVTNDSKKYGHVALVEQVTDHNSVIVSEMNYEHFGKVDYREIPLTSSSIKGFIHP